MDVKNAFLHGDLEEEVFIKLSSGHPQGGDSKMVCQLHKSTYGLKQSLRAWHAKLSTAIEALGFKRSSIDSSLYVQVNTNENIIITSNNMILLLY